MNNGKDKQRHDPIQLVLPTCPTCKSANNRLEENRLQCADCGYDQPHKYKYSVCQGNHFATMKKKGICKDRNPSKKPTLNHCPICKLQKLSKNGMHIRCNNCGWTHE